MKRQIVAKNHLGKNLNLIRHSLGLRGKLRDLGIFEITVKKTQGLYGKIPSLVDTTKQGQIYDSHYKKSYASNINKVNKTLEIIVTLAASTHTNYSSMCAILPI